MSSHRLIAFLLPLLSGLTSAESFEGLATGPLKEGSTSIGEWKRAKGDVLIHRGNARTGRQSLFLKGDSSVTLNLESPAKKGTFVALHSERWTKRDPFSLRIEAEVKGKWTEIRDASEVKVGGFLTEIRLALPEGAGSLRFNCLAPTDGGVLLDDLSILESGPATATLIETTQPVCPAFIREDFNPVLGFLVRVKGSEGTTMLESLEFGFGGSTRLSDIESFRIVEGSADPSAEPIKIIAEGNRIAEKLSIDLKHPLAPGDHWFWISPALGTDASIDGHIDASVFRVKVGGKVMEPSEASPKGSQRIGYAVRLPGDDKAKSYRIPGIVQTTRGNLIAAYDVRYDHSGDLPANIDVGISRSTDGGQSWEPMRVAIDMGNDPKHGHDGVGDPAILVDPTTGRIWIASLWSHGNRGWNGSGPGIKPEETGQLVLAHSDDEGKTWSKPVNITAQMKDPEWRLFFNGPGAGIAMKNGTLVFAAQYRAADGKPWSTMISSEDHGETWQVGSGVKSDTTEAQVAELADGSVMINARDNRGGSRTVAVTRDLGKTWELHSSDRKALREPVCMGSLLSWNDSLWFSNPDATDGRHSMTLKRSRDQGESWPEKDQILYDSRSGFGYSCLAPAGESKLGVIYEGKNTLYFLRFPVAE